MIPQTQTCFSTLRVAITMTRRPGRQSGLCKGLAIARYLAEQRSGAARMILLLRHWDSQETLAIPALDAARPSA